ncbi:MAG: 6-pyruvoyl-tetrahydropterin synthase-related protein [Patescibacteria group bacterium]
MNSLKHYLVILTISALPLLSMFLTKDMPHTHDGPVHLARIASYYKELSYGQIPPRWASELNYAYGMPLFNFMYHLPYLIASIPVYFSLGLVLSFKLSLFLSFLLSGIGMFLFAKKLFNDTARAYLVTLLYQFAPFHLVEFVVRGSIGEAYTYSFLPFVLHGILLLGERSSIKRSMYVGISTALLILSHNAISLVSFTVAVLFSLWLTPKKSRFIVFLSLFFAVMITAFYWMPAVFERKYTYGDLFMKDMYKSHFAPLLNFFTPNFTNDSARQTGGITVYLGLIQSMVVLLGTYLLIFKKIKNRMAFSLTLFSLLVIMGSMFFMQPASAFLWARISVLRMFQFPWRLLSVVGLGTALLGGLIVFRDKKIHIKIIAILSLVTVSTTLVFWKPPLGYDKITESDYWNYPLNTTYFGETDLIWSDGPASSYPTAPFELIDGKGSITNIYKKSIHHSFTINAETLVQILDHTQYFPGWRVFVDDVKTPIEFQDQNHRGRITFTVPKGIHTVRVEFGSSPIRTIGNVLSILSGIIGLLLYVFFKKRHTKKGS